jgi:pimeloyl-ACP methyl ester carboxylesterase
MPDPTHRLTDFRDDFFREGALRDICVDARKYCVLDIGQGPVLVLLHGLGGSIYDWRHLIRPLSESHRVVAIDLLGAGESDLPTGEDYSIAAQARRVKGVLDALGVRRATMIGSSYGGGIVLRFAQDWPERVERLVLINSVCYAESIPTYVYLARAPWAGCIAETVPLGKATRWVLANNDRTIDILSDAELETYNQELRKPGRRRAMVDVLRSLVPADPTEFEARLGSIRAPSLLIWGAADTTVPIELGRRLQRDLPDAQLHAVNAGHVPNQECPEEVLQLILTFLP